MQASEERTGCDFGPCYSVRIQGKLFVWRARHWRSSPWISLPRMDGEAIIDFAFNSFKSFVYSSLFYQLVCWEFCKNLAVCGCRGRRRIHFLKKTIVSSNVHYCVCLKLVVVWPFVDEVRFSVSDKVMRVGVGFLCPRGRRVAAPCSRGGMCAYLLLWCSASILPSYSYVKLLHAGLELWHFLFFCKNQFVTV